MQHFTLAKITLVLATIVACIGHTTAASAGLKEEAAKFKGKHIKKVIAKLGYPVSERRILNEKIFTWAVDNSTTISIPQYNTGTAYGSGGGSATYSYITSTPVDWTLKCKLEFVTGLNNKVKEVIVSQQGLGACWGTSRKLSGKKPPSPLKRSENDLGAK